ncbi:response regulator transcription factor [Streptomyces litchfieldiae]|uniref:LuxR C-terminal-related transcriptional regulator n=1 Tax=Streptomyces litchfieldiae TaxID=3075543 RepID=A0ABU2MUX6_9ACTN|nr:LuxR C-terminal-related transcriptional regulator [Streptomyces sp. DSM 44938]MDT0345446.1 LuxR C-terminal-related transcriptional regulator [Streptomyces sp. DSM 44938]
MDSAAVLNATAGEERKGLDIALLIENEVIRSGLATMLRSLERTAMIRSCDPLSLSEILASREIDVLIVAFDQWPLLENARNSRCGTPRILVLGDKLDENVGGPLPQLPADGFISLAGLSSRVLAETIERMAAGEIPMPAALARRLLTAPRVGYDPAEARPVALTAREHETLTLLSRGLSNKQIAALLGISPHGAKRLVAAVLLKLGAPNRTAAVVAAMKSGLVPGSPG